jgi:hypothetical protein
VELETQASPAVLGSTAECKQKGRYPFMTSAELELEAELEDLMGTLGGSHLESEDKSEFEGAAAPPRCTPVGTQVSANNFTCMPIEQALVATTLGKAFPVAALREVVNSSAARAVMLAGTAASSLDIANRTAASRMAFCSSFGVLPDFVPAWRATLPGRMNWRDLGELIAIRLRKAAGILNGGCIRYFCWGNRVYCPDCTDPPQKYVACSSWKGRYGICIGPSFWKRWLARNETSNDLTLLHECLHIVFQRFVGDKFYDKQQTVLNRPIANAYCYTKFVACINRLPVPKWMLQRCSATGPCAPMTLDNFRFGGQELRPQHTPLINQIALMTGASRDTSCPVGTILLKGFTDSVEHTAGYNVVLGLRRALSVKDGITAAIRALDPAIAAGVIFVPTTFGAAQPVGPNATPVGRAKNRRVEVTLQPM